MANKDNVTKEAPCPICGGTDWCKWCTGQNGPLLACHRGPKAGSRIITGVDGQQYYFSHMGATGECYMYETYEQHLAAVEKWKKLNGYTRNSIRSNCGKLSKPVIVPTRREYVVKIQPCSEDPEHLDRVYSALLRLLKPDSKTISYLKSEKWTDDMIKLYKIKTLPMSDSRRYEEKIKLSAMWRKQLCKELLRELGNDALLGVPGFYMNSNGQWSIYGAPQGGIVFPVFNIDGKIIRLRIRPYYSEVDILKGINEGRKLPKYLNLHSCKAVRNPETMEITNQLTNGCAAGNVVGFYMFDKDGKWIQNPEVLFFTEGEKKSAVYNYHSGKCVVCIQGVGSWRKFTIPGENSEPSLAEECRNRGARYAIVGFDADKETNYHVLRSENGLLTELKNKGYIVAVAEWNQRIAKGIDDLCSLGLEPQIYLC